MKTNQFRAMVLALLMAVISLATVSAQAITVSGTVTDAKDGTPLVGCSVQIKGTTKGTVTNMNGQYTIQSKNCLLYTSPSPRDRSVSRMPSSA